MKRKFINSAFIFMAIGLTCLPSFAASPGSLDPSFGVAGVVRTPFVTGSNFLTDIAVGDDGKITAVVEQLSQPVSDDFFVARYMANGVFDTTFGGDGIVTTDFGGGDDGAKSVVIQSDGKTVVCGSFTQTRNTGIARYNVDGSLDTTFDTDGKQTINNVSCEALSIQQDGRIIGVGDSVNTDLLVYRLNLNGSFDTSFGSGGFVSTAVGGTDNTFRDVKIQQDGKIVAVGVLGDGQQSIFARYNPNGSLDSSFSGDGLVTIDTSSGFDRLIRIAIDPASNTIIGVGFYTTTTTTTTEVLAVRLTPEGQFDSSFNAGGIFRIINGNGSSARDVLIQSDRKIVILSRSRDTAALLRLNLNGTLDPTIGINLFLPKASPATMAFSGDKLIVGSDSVFDLVGVKVSRHNLANTPTASSDFDGDGVTDVAIYRPSVGQWFVLRSSDNSVLITQFGLNGDVPIDGDFDGDGRNDLAIFRPSSGVWFFQRSSDNTVLGATFGIGTDKPIPGDYDKDGKTDLAVFRPSTGDWFVLRSSSNFATFFGFQFGQNGDIPISSERK